MSLQTSSLRLLMNYSRLISVYSKTIFFCSLKQLILLKPYSRTTTIPPCILFFWLSLQLFFIGCFYQTRLTKSNRLGGGCDILTMFNSGRGFLISLLVAVLSLPSCRIKPYPKQLALLKGETGSLPLSDIFMGFNLSYSIQGEYPLFHLRNKIINVAEAELQIPISEIRVRRVFGKTLYLLYQKNSTTRVRVVKPLQSAEQEDFQVGEGIQCHGLAVSVDFVFIDCVNNSIPVLIVKDKIDFRQVNKVITYLFADFKQVKQTELEVVLLRGRQYLVRTFLAAKVVSQSNNTYAQLFQVKQLMSKQVALPSFVLDRAFLRLEQLAITGVAWAQDKVLVLDAGAGLFAIEVNAIREVHLQARLGVKGGLSLSLFNDQVAVGFASGQIILYRFSKLQFSPSRKHHLPQDCQLESILFDGTFLYSQSKCFYGRTYWVFSQRQTTYGNSFFVAPFLFQYPYWLAISSSGLIEINGGVVRLKIYQEPKLWFYIKQTTQLSNLTVLGYSASFPDYQQCFFALGVKIVGQQEKVLVDSGIQPPFLFEFNYPGTFYIRLDNYFQGPDIQYALEPTIQDKTVPSHWLLQYNLTAIQWLGDEPPPNPIFSKMEAKSRQLQQVLQLFLQHSDFTLSIYQCIGGLAIAQLSCRLKSKVPFSQPLNLFAWEETRSQDRFFVVVAGQSLHVFRNEEERLFIGLGTGYQSVVQQLRMSDGLLFVLKKYSKQIEVYELSNCFRQACVPKRIDSSYFESEGFAYYFPLGLDSSAYHPRTVLIKTNSELFLVEFDLLMRPYLKLSLAHQESGDFRAVLSQDHICIQNQRGLFVIQLWNLTQSKKLPLYQFQSDLFFGIEKSDFSNQIFIAATDQNRGRFILVIDPADISAISLQKSIPQGNCLLKAVSGLRVNYLLSLCEAKLAIAQVYEYPQLVIRSENKSQSANLAFRNSQQNSRRKSIRFSVANQAPQIVEVNNWTRNKAYLGQLVRSMDRRNVSDNYTFSDSRWWKGNILGYEVSAPDLSNKIIFHDHFRPVGNQSAAIVDCVQHGRGSLYLQDRHVFVASANGSIVAQSLIKTTGHCLKIAASSFYAVSACSQAQGISLFLTYLSNKKPFTSSGFPTRVLSVAALQAVEEVVMMVEEAGSVHLYQVGGQQLLTLALELEPYDLALAGGLSSQPVITSSSMRRTEGALLLAVSATTGFFIVQLDEAPLKIRISVRSVHYFSLAQVLTPYQMRMPVDSAILDIHFVQVINPSLFKILLGCFGFNSFYGTLDLLGNDYHPQLVLQRYGNYWLQGRVAVSRGRAMLTFVRSPLQEYDQNASRIVFGVYDLNTSSAKGLETRYFAGMAGSPGDRAYLEGQRVSILNRGLQFFQFSPNLTIEVTDQFTYSQVLKGKARNDYSTKEFDLPLNLFQGAWPVWAILVTISGVCLLLAAAVVALSAYRRKQKDSRTIPLIEEVLSQQSGQGSLVETGEPEPQPQEGPLPAETDH